MASTSGQGSQHPAAVAASAQPYKRLARLAVRAFYAGTCPPPTCKDAGDLDGMKTKLGKIDTTGLGIIIMDYLLSKEWVGEAEICETIKVHQKLIRRALKYLEREHLLMSEHRRETRRSMRRDAVRSVMSAHAEAERNSEDEQDEEDALMRPHTISYYAVDFPRLFDVVQLRLYVMRKVLKDELDCKEVLAQYKCTNDWCGKVYDSLEVNWLIKPTGEMQCDMCEGQLHPVLASGQTGDDLARRERKAIISSRLTRMDEQLKDLNQLVSALRNSQPPFYGTLREWAVSQQQMLVKMEDGRSGGDGRGGRGGGGAIMHGSLGDAAGATNFYEEPAIEVNLLDNLPGGGGAESASGAGGGAAGAAERSRGAVAAAAAAAVAAAASRGDAKPGASAIPWMKAKPGAGASDGADGADGVAGGSASGSGAGDVKGMGEEERKQAYVQAYMAMLAAQQQAKEAAAASGLPSAAPTMVAAAGVPDGVDSGCDDPGGGGKRARQAAGAARAPLPRHTPPPGDDELEWEESDRPNTGP
ncbi:hypothetical protein FOA52_004074 [Chlamydomonas sp. UWO 241]|nr:hypothetical protein FOA52_004074 [Chlamydomonas sp. UWO 241]